MDKQKEIESDICQLFTFRDDAFHKFKPSGNYDEEILFEKNLKYFIEKWSK